MGCSIQCGVTAVVYSVDQTSMGNGVALETISTSVTIVCIHWTMLLQHKHILTDVN